jgi:hypothetical protein
MLAKASTFRFLDLPSLIRERIYAYLLSPDPEEDVTTINYTLSWSYLDSPSNTTFAGPTQIDFCSCPREDIDHKEGEHELHIYTRYKCAGPEVHFNTLSQGLWILHTAHGQFNILRPATQAELEDRPSVAILQVSKQLQEEALPFMYRNRDFFFITGPCPRGRYQAYATLQWLRQLRPQARAGIEILSLLMQPYEEDCNVTDVEGSYSELAAYIHVHLPSFRWLCLDVWDDDVYQAAHVFLRLFERDQVGIVVRRPLQDYNVEVFISEEGFLGSFGMIEIDTGSEGDDGEAEIDSNRKGR